VRAPGCVRLLQRFNRVIRRRFAARPRFKACVLDCDSLIVSFDFGRDLVDGPLEEGVAFRRCHEFTSLVSWARDFFEPTPEEQNVVLVNTTTLRETERLIDQTRLSECPASWAENRGGWHIRPAGRMCRYHALSRRVAESR
jgi:hypothetical protein